MLALTTTLLEAYTELTTPARRLKPLTGASGKTIDRIVGTVAGSDATAQGISGKRMRLLVIEDNVRLREFLADGLGGSGFSIDSVETAGDAREALSTTRYAAIILDLGLPDGDGLSILREARRRKDSTPVIILTARSGVDDRVAGLRSGADDYLVKPFAIEELIARIEALLRRPSQMVGRSLKLSNLMFDTQSRQVFVDDKPQMLSAREVAVLELLMQRKGHVVSKKMVEDHIFGLSGEISSNAVEVYVHRLRKQLADLEAKVQIHTVRGIGYVLIEES